MYLYLAFFWLILGGIAQYYWEPLQQHAYIPVHRTVFGFVFFLLFMYNFARWRMGRVMRQPPDDTSPPPKPRVVEYDPTFDFSKPDPDEKKPPTP